MKLYYRTVGSIGPVIEVLDEAATVFIVNDEGHVIQVSDTIYSQHGQAGFNVHAGEGMLTVIPMAANAIVVFPERKGAAGIPVKKTRRKR
jgi:hypothetical protein